MVFLIMNSIDILEELRMLMVTVAIFVGRPHEEFNRYLGRARNVYDDHDTFVERF